MIAARPVTDTRPFVDGRAIRGWPGSATGPEQHRRCQAPIHVGDLTVRFASEATRRLGIWLDSELTLVENRRRRIGSARQAEAALSRIVSKYGVPPASCRNLQSAIVQGTCSTALSSPGMERRASKESIKTPSTVWSEPPWVPSDQHRWGPSPQRAASRPPGRS